MTMESKRYSDILIIGGGAAGLMAAVGAAGDPIKVTVLEKMPKVGRKIMISGKGRCNFTNMSEWNDFSRHVHPKADLLKPAFFALPPRRIMEMIEFCGCPCVVERGGRVFPESHRSADIVDVLLATARKAGAEIITDCEVSDVGKNADGRFTVSTGLGEFTAGKLIITTGGLSYPGTGSTGDGYGWAEKFGHRISGLFPSLTAIVPAGYKNVGAKGHIDRAVPLTEWGRQLAGIQLKNVGLTVETDGNISDSDFGDLDFTDGGIEGPLGFRLSRKAVKAMINGARVTAHIDLKPAVEAEQLEKRIDQLWQEISTDRRSFTMIRGRQTPRPYRERFDVLLTKLLPKELVRPFAASNPGLDSRTLGKALKDWKLPIAGFVGYERCVVTAGGVAPEEVNRKDLESKLVPGLHFAGEVLDLDADTGGYNLQIAFCTGHLAGVSARNSLILQTLR